MPAKSRKPRTKSAEESTKCRKEGPKRKKGKSAKGKSRIPGRLAWIMAAVLILVLGNLYFLDISRVNTNSMMPGLSRDDLVLSWAPSWVTPELETGSIALLDLDGMDEEDTEEPNFLRVMGCQGDHVVFHDDKLEISGRIPKRRLLTNDAIVRPDNEPEIWRETLWNGQEYRIMVPRQPIVGKRSGESSVDGVFLVGDNRMASYDSRQSGSYEPGKIRGRALFIIKSARNDGILGHWLKPIDG